MEMFILVLFSILLIVSFGLLGYYYVTEFIDKITRPKRYANAINELNRRKCKITYQNQSTGTISYIEKGVKHQIMVYCGYNSHANPY